MHLGGGGEVEGVYMCKFMTHYFAHAFFPVSFVSCLFLVYLTDSQEIETNV